MIQPGSIEAAEAAATARSLEAEAADLRERLRRLEHAIAVLKAASGDRPMPSHRYVFPGDFDTTI